MSWQAWLAVTVGLVILALALTVNGFTQPSMLFNLTRAFALLGILAVGQSLVMVAGGIDLSVGSTYGFAGILLAILSYSGYGFGATLLACVGVGSAIGLFNGLLVAKLGFKPFIATFAMLAIIRAIAYLSHDIIITLTGATVKAPTWKFLSSGHSQLWLSPSFFILIGLAVGAWLLLKYTRFGLWAHGTGGNINAARAVGVPIDMVRIITYVISGVLAAVAGMLSAGAVEGVRPFDGAGDELTSLAAVIIGGASLAGGSASILGTMLAVLLFILVNRSVAIIGLAPHYQQIVSGLIVLLALLLTRLSLGRGSAKKSLVT
jgi:ribose/xylose/arabinose/galactoside ABC-type transport system permease subunit